MLLSLRKISLGICLIYKERPEGRLVRIIILAEAMKVQIDTTETRVQAMVESMGMLVIMGIIQRV